MAADEARDDARDDAPDDRRASRQRILAAAAASGIGTLAIVVVIVGLVLVDRVRQDREVQSADEASAHYVERLSELRIDTAQSLTRAADSPSRVEQVAERARDRVPEPPKIDGLGAERSGAYQSLPEQRRDLDGDLRGVQRAADRAESESAYLDAAQQLVDQRPATVQGAQSDGSQVRSRIIEPLEADVDAFEQRRAPSTLSDLRTVVLNEYRALLLDYTLVAANLDLGAGGTIEATDRYQRMSAVLLQARTASRAALVQSFDEVAGGQVPDAG